MGRKESNQTNKISDGLEKSHIKTHDLSTQNIVC